VLKQSSKATAGWVNPISDKNSKNNKRKIKMGPQGVT
jgi:hypothetical protein